MTSSEEFIDFTDNTNDHIIAKEHIFEKLIQATSQGHIDMVKEILKQNPDIINEQCKKTKTSALMYAIYKQNKKMIKLLLKKGVPNGRTCGAWQSTTEQVRADVLLRDFTGYNALIIASMKSKNLSILRLLLKAGAGIHIDKKVYTNFAFDSAIDISMSNLPAYKLLVRYRLLISWLYRQNRNKIPSDIIRESFYYIV
jgi:ankyrin repeat protein